MKDELRIVFEADRLLARGPRLPDGRRVRPHALDQVDQLEEVEPMPLALEEAPQMSVDDPFRAGHVNRFRDGEPSSETRVNEVMDA